MKQRLPGISPPKLELYTPSPPPMLGGYVNRWFLTADDRERMLEDLLDVFHPDVRDDMTDGELDTLWFKVFG